VIEILGEAVTDFAVQFHSVIPSAIRVIIPALRLRSGIIASTLPVITIGAAPSAV
jgi:hypothetical protein